MASIDRFAAFAVLRGPDTVAETNPTEHVRNFRKSASLQIARGGISEQLERAASETPTALSGVGKNLDRLA